MPSRRLRSPRVRPAAFGAVVVGAVALAATVGASTAGTPVASAATTATGSTAATGTTARPAPAAATRQSFIFAVPGSSGFLAVSGAGSPSSSALSAHPEPTYAAAVEWAQLREEWDYPSRIGERGTVKPSDRDGCVVYSGSWQDYGRGPEPAALIGLSPTCTPNPGTGSGSVWEMRPEGLVAVDSRTAAESGFAGHAGGRFRLEPDPVNEVIGLRPFAPGAASTAPIDPTDPPDGGGASDNLTADAAFPADIRREAEVTGRADAGAAITIVAEGRTLATTTADASGRYGVPVPAPGSGGPRLLTVEERVGGRLQETTQVTLDYGAPVRIDTPAPGASVPPGPLPVTGRGEPGSTVELRRDGVVVAEVTVGADGTWRATLPGR